jgi:CRP-like cAMP-binding protein/DNA-binding NarL/FixJ family response regulator
MTTKILIAEDESIVALDMAHDLESAGYTVVGQVSNGQAAIRATTDLHPDVVLLDITMPGEIDGIQAAEEISREHDIPIIFVTAHSDEATLQRVKLTRPSGYVMKPFEPNELRANIEIALHKAASGFSSVSEDERNVMPELSKEFAKLPEGVDEFKFDALRATDVFQNLPVKELTNLAQAASIQDVAAGEYLSLDGESPAFGFLVISGRLAVVKSTQHGKELTLDLLIPGDSTGIVRALEPLDLDTAIRGQTDAKLLSIPTSSLHALAERHPMLYRTIAEELMKKNRRINDLALGLAHSRVESRIIATLIALAPRFGRPTSVAEQTRIFLTRKELADLTGTTPETAIRVTKNLEREGFLDLTKPGVIKILSLSDFEQALER